MRLPPAATAFARSSPQTPSRFCQPRGIEPRTLRIEADSLTIQLDWAVLSDTNYQLQQYYQTVNVGEVTVI